MHTEHHDRNEMRKHRILKSKLKRQRRTAKKNNDTDTVEKLTRILNDDLQLELLCAEICSQYDACCEDEGYHARSNSIIEWFSWLLENWGSIWEMIQQIINLFESDTDA